jgi:hypothetical protein
MTRVPVVVLAGMIAGAACGQAPEAQMRDVAASDDLVRGVAAEAQRAPEFRTVMKSGRTSYVFVGVVAVRSLSGPHHSMSLSAGSAALRDSVMPCRPTRDA